MAPDRGTGVDDEHDSFGDLTVEQFLSRLATGSANPAGGSFAAFVGAGGAAAVEMVCALTLCHDTDEATRADLEAIATEMAAERETLVALADEDAAAFASVLAATDLPPGDDRKTAMQDALQQATEIPLETAAHCATIVDRAETVTKASRDDAVTDAVAGARFAHAALRSASHFVASNLRGIDDASYVETVDERRATLVRDATDTLDAIEAHLATRT